MVVGRLDRYIAREVALSTAAVQLVLFLILVTNHGLRLLADVAGGELPADVVAVVLGSFALKIFIRLLPIALYLGIILAFGRLYRDSEIVVMRACGVRDPDLYRPVLLVTVPVVALLTVATLNVVPWTIRVTEMVTDAARDRSELAGVRPGRFGTSNDGEYTLFVEKLTRGSTGMQGVFLTNRSGPAAGVETAERGRQSVDPVTGDRYLVLGPGVRYEGVPGIGRFRTIEYEEHGVLIRRKKSSVELTRLSGKSSGELLRSAELRDQVELRWRTVGPVSALVLALLALPLSHVSPRQGRFGKLAAGVMVYIVYMNLLGVNHVWMEKGVVGLFPGFWWVHALGVTVAILLLARQNHWLARWRTTSRAVT